METNNLKKNSNPKYWFGKFKDLTVEIRKAEGENAIKVKIKKIVPYSLMPYFMLRVKCNRDRDKFNCHYETIIVGDECDEEDEAKENVYKKGLHILQRELRLLKRNKSQPRSLMNSTRRDETNYWEN